VCAAAAGSALPRGIHLRLQRGQLCEGGVGVHRAVGFGGARLEALRRPLSAAAALAETVLAGTLLAAPFVAAALGAAAVALTLALTVTRAVALALGRSILLAVPSEALGAITPAVTPLEARVRPAFSTPIAAALLAIASALEAVAVGPCRLALGRRGGRIAAGGLGRLARARATAALSAPRPPALLASAMATVLAAAMVLMVATRRPPDFDLRDFGCGDFDC
jgi:hypothetical protein